MRLKGRYLAVVVLLTVWTSIWGTLEPATAQPPRPTLADQNLMVREFVSGLNQPTSMTFIGRGEILILGSTTRNRRSP